MHILFVTPAFSPRLSGGERYAFNLARELSRRGHQLTVITSCATAEADFWLGRRDPILPPGDEPALQIQRFPIRPWPAGRHGLTAWRRLMIILDWLPGQRPRLLARMSRLVPPLQGLDGAALPAGLTLIHAFNLSWEYPLIQASHWARKRRLPLVVTPFAHPTRRRQRRHQTMAHQRQTLHQATRIQALSPAEKAGLVAWGMPEPRLDIVGSGIDPPPTGLDRSLASLSLPEPYALFIGRLTDEKGALQAAAATARLRREGLNLGLALVGDASPEFSRFYERLGESARAAIRPLGRVEEVQKHALLSTCMMLLLPSRADAFGLVLLEAWSHGRPVIGARAGGIPGVIDHGRDGLLVPYGDVDALAAAMRRLFLNEAERRAMGQAGRQKIATEYRWPQVVDRVLLSYERALHPAASRA